MMDEVDRVLLNRIQKEFPIHSRPFEILAQGLGISEEEALKRIKRLKERGIIRRLGGSFDSQRLGFVSTLCAVKVPPKEVASFVEVVNSYKGVTHNYQRSSDDYNIWFTFITESEEKIKKALEEISQRTGIKEILNLPKVRSFKLDVNFET